MEKIDLDLKNNDLNDEIETIKKNYDVVMERLKNLEEENLTYKQFLNEIFAEIPQDILEKYYKDKEEQKSDE